MTIRCFLHQNQYDQYLMIYRKYYYKWYKWYIQHIIPINKKYYEQTIYYTNKKSRNNCEKFRVIYDIIYDMIKHNELNNFIIGINRCLYELTSVKKNIEQYSLIMLVYNKFKIKLECMRSNDKCSDIDKFFGLN